MIHHQYYFSLAASCGILVSFFSKLSNGIMTKCDKTKLQFLLNEREPCELELKYYVKQILENYSCNETIETLNFTYNSKNYPHEEIKYTYYYVYPDDFSGSGDEQSSFHNSCQAPGTSQQLLTEFTCNFKRYRENCNKLLEETRKTFSENEVYLETYCPGEFDGMICWPHSKNETLVGAPCPNFLTENVTEATNASSHRFCMGDGTWYKRKTDGKLDTWRILVNCNPLKQILKFRKDSDSATSSFYNHLTVACQIGYAISITFMVAALVIFAAFKKLRCVRNYIHVNLMISFMLRYLTMLLCDHFAYDFYIKSPQRLLNNQTCEEYLNSEAFTKCRLTTTVWHYALISNYFWLLVEGIHLLILLTMPLKSSKSRKFFPLYIALGWAFPLVPAMIWATLKLFLENVDCWRKKSKYHLEWAIELPVLLTIVINFFIFIYVICIIMSKLRSKNRNKSDFKTSLAWSTLALMPLLGIHYILFLIIPGDTFGPNSPIKNAKIGFEAVMTSFQGFLVALFYCFLNAEVQGEVKKRWKKYQTLKKLSNTVPRKVSANNANYTQATSLGSTVHPEERQLIGKNNVADAQV